MTLAVLARITSKKRGPRFRCLCQCGRKLHVKAAQLATTKNCGKCASGANGNHGRTE